MKCCRQMILNEIWVLFKKFSTQKEDGSLELIDGEFSLVYDADHVMHYKNDLGKYGGINAHGKLEHFDDIDLMQIQYEILNRFVADGEIIDAVHTRNNEPDDYDDPDDYETGNLSDIIFHK